MGERLVIGTAPRKRIPVKPLALALGVVCLLAMALTRLVFFELVQVRGDTMAPNAMEGDILLVASLGEPALGSVVLVEQGDREVLRRVVGVAGDHMTTEDGLLVRNGAPLSTTEVGVFGWLREADGQETRPHRQALVDEGFADGRRHRVLGDHDGAARPWRLALPEVEVPPGHVFVLCDNRRICPLDDQSGPIPVGRITGVARWVMWYGDTREAPPDSRPFYGAFRRLGSARGSGGAAGGDPPAQGLVDAGSSADGDASYRLDGGADGGSADPTTDSPLK